MSCLESGSPVSYTQTNKKTTVTLNNAITGLPVTNTSGLPINVTMRYVVNSCQFYGPIYDDVVIPIPNGSDHGDYNYASITYINCGTSTCTTVTKDIHCGLSTGDINTEFDSTITVC